MVLFLLMVADLFCVSRDINTRAHEIDQFIIMSVDHWHEIESTADAHIHRDLPEIQIICVFSLFFFAFTANYWMRLKIANSTHSFLFYFQIAHINTL